MIVDPLLHRLKQIEIKTSGLGFKRSEIASTETQIDADLKHLFPNLVDVI